MRRGNAPAYVVDTGHIWGCEISSFPWTYDEQETCLLLEGDVSVTPNI